MKPEMDTAKKLHSALSALAPRAEGGEAHLAAALAQVADSPGKMVRGQIVYAAARHHDLSEGASEQLACAVELFHSASLLLDDLPCMDDATTRRGRECVHRIHGDATAILAALALINRAHVLVGFAFATQPAETRVQALLCVDEMLGAFGLLGGQARDLRFAERARTAREVGQIAAGKTGALFRLALLLPALAAQPEPGEFSRLRALAVYWGQWFQAIDDLKDILGSEATSGKTTQRDRVLDRPNLALILGVPAARRRIARLEQQILRTLAHLGRYGTRWEYLTRFHAQFSPQAAAA